MAKNVRVKLNYRGVRSEILKAPWMTQLLREAAERAADEDMTVTSGESGTRVNATISLDGDNPRDREAKTGALSRAIGRIHV